MGQDLRSPSGMGWQRMRAIGTFGQRGSGEKAAIRLRLNGAGCPTAEGKSSARPLKDQTAKNWRWMAFKRALGGGARGDRRVVSGLWAAYGLSLPILPRILHPHYRSGRWGNGKGPLWKKPAVGAAGRACCVGRIPITACQGCHWLCIFGWQSRARVAARAVGTG